MKASIVIVDDHAMIREGLKVLLEEEPDLTVVGEAANGEEAIAIIDELEPDVVLMDISMPGLSGVEATRSILSSKPEAKIVALSLHSGPKFIQDMLQAGAVGYILKESIPEEIVEGIRAVLRGEVFLSAAVAKTVVSQVVAAPVTESEEGVTLRFPRTKLHRASLSSDALPRSSVVEELDRNKQKQLTLLSAPAGYGKSSLASLWLEGRDGPSAWLSLDENDNELRTFLTGVVTAVQEVFPGTGKQTLKLLDTPVLPSQRVLTLQLLNDLEAIDEDFVLVLDDYHVIRDQAVHEVMSVVLRYPPPPLHLVVVTRRDPSLPVSTLRDQGQVHEVTVQQLRFSPEETLEFLEGALETTLDGKAIAIVEEVFEGWPTGLRLLAQTLKHHEEKEALLNGLKGDLGSTTDYLVSEVLDRLPPEIANQLFKVAILDRFSVPLCDVVCGVPDRLAEHGGVDATKLIAWLQENNLFLVSLDDEGSWFRFHHLFQQILRKATKQRLDLDEISDLHAIAGRWFEAEGLIDEALHHALEGGDTPGAASIVERHRKEVLARDSWHVLSRWLKKLPDGIKHERQELLMAQAWVHFHHLEFPSILAICEELDAMPSDDASIAQVQGEIDFFRGYACYFGADGAHSEAYLRSAVERLPDDHEHVKGEAMLHHALSLHMLGEKEKALRGLQDALAADSQLKNIQSTRLWAGLFFIHLLDASLAEVMVPAQKTREIGARDGALYSMSWGRYAESCALYFQNSQEETLSSLEQLDPILQAMHTRAAIDALAGLVLLSQATLGPAKTREAERHLLDFANAVDDPSVMAVAESCRARLALLQGDVESAARWLRTADLTPDAGIMLWWIEVPRVTACKVLIAEGTTSSLEEALVKLRTYEQENRSVHNTLRLIEILTLQALARSKQSKMEPALATLKEALSLASPGGVARPFVELGSSITDMLGSLDGQTDDAPFIEILLAQMETFEEYPSAPTSSRPSQPVETAPRAQQAPVQQMTPQPLVDPLTIRELDVLELIEKRLRDKEIADQLCVSPHTVKSHLKNLYQKLGVSSRLEAVARARELGIVTRR